MTLMKKLLLCGLLPFIGCAASRPALKTVDNVDLQKYMGPWYVLASIPPFVEKDSYNSVESYKLDPDGSIDTIFTFNKGSLNGPVKKLNPRGFVVDKVNNSTWKVQFFWPVRLEYLITYLTDDYSQVIVSRNRRDYVWIMARTPRVPDADYQKMVDIVKEQGYDLTKLRRVPHN